ncbi:hypothetical protein EST38_g3507 [Candolleomyces aberdarensis]|uniref:Uncharacterized protein n=1 Tax=Candolleomyces aberdarensis TaxID=2316362 RepID=A0A4Q2DTA2_9AGAR|nr:hypothetical protein EST38_g3507 [Candolleomyces aberdarensis]
MPFGFNKPKQHTLPQYYNSESSGGLFAMDMRIFALLLELQCEELTLRLIPYFETLVGWVEVFCVAGHIESSARLFYELWRLSPDVTNRFRDPGSNVMKSLLSLWVSEDSRTKSHIFSSTNLCPLINLFLGLTLDDHSKTLIVAALDAESSEGVTTVAQAFRLRMEEIVALHKDGAITCEFAVKHLAKLAEILDRLLPADSRGYRSRFLCEEHLLSSFYRSLALIMPTYQADATWSVAAGTLKYLSRFIFEAGEYSGNPVTKLVEVISGSITVLLLGCIFNLAPSDPKHDAALNYMNKIAPCFMYRRVWKAAVEYFPLERVKILPNHLFEQLCAHSALAGSTWTALQVAFHEAMQNMTLIRMPHVPSSVLTAIRSSIALERARAAMQLNQSVNQPFIGRLNITTLPYLIRVCPPSEYTLPNCEDPVFMDQTKSWLEEFGHKRGHQLLEVSFSYGTKGHLAMIHLHGHGDGVRKVVHGVFALEACGE